MFVGDFSRVGEVVLEKLRVNDREGESSVREGVSVTAAASTPALNLGTQTKKKRTRKRIVACTKVNFFIFANARVFFL